MHALRSLALATGAALTLVAPAGASAVETATNFRWSSPVPLVYVTSTPHATFFGIAPLESALPHVGRASVQTSFSTCSPYPCEPTGSASLWVDMSAVGGTLVLHGVSSSHDELANSGTWIVSQATGRFAGYTGAGTWSWAWTYEPPPWGAATIELAGRLVSR